MTKWSLNWKSAGGEVGRGGGGEVGGGGGREGGRCHPCGSDRNQQISGLFNTGLTDPPLHCGEGTVLNLLIKYKLLICSCIVVLLYPQTPEPGAP